MFVVWGSPYAIGSLYDLIRGEFLNKLSALSDIFPHWLYYAWLGSGIFAFAIITFVTAYRIQLRHDKDKDKKIDNIQSQLDELKVKLDERNKNRKIADDLAKFAVIIERFRDEDAVDLIDVEGYTTNVVPHIEAVFSYLRENCSLATATQFKTIPDFIADTSIQLNHRLNNLLKIIEYYNQRS